MDAKEYLRQYRELKNYIIRKQEELELFREDLMHPSTVRFSNKVKMSVRHDLLEQMICKYEDAENELKERYQKLFEIRLSIVKLIEQLPVNEYDFLHQHYIQGKSLQEISNHFDRSYSWATSMHGKAIKHFQQLLDER